MMGFANHPDTVKAVTGLVDCISNKGQTKGAGDITKTVKTLIDNIKDVWGKLTKKANRDIAKIVEDEFAGNFAKMRDRIEEALERAQGKELTIEGDETQECKLEEKGKCGGELKCGKMLSSKTGFMCCSNYFLDDNNKPHCSHDSRLWSMLVKDGKINPKVSKTVARMAVGQAVNQITALKDSGGLEPELKCAVEHIILPVMPKLEKFLAQLLTKAITKMAALSNKMFGGKKLTTFVIDSVTDLVGQSNLVLAEDTVKKIQVVVRAKVDQFCEEQMANTAKAGKALKEAKPGQGGSNSAAGKKICEVKAVVDKGEVGPVLKKAALPMLGTGLDWVYTKFFEPIESDITNKLMSAWAVVNDFVVGLAGLIPEVGGLISDVIMIPIEYLKGSLVHPLVTSLQNGLWKTARPKILAAVKPIMDAAIAKIEQAAKAAKVKAEEVMKDVEGAVQDAKNLRGKVVDMTQLFAPILNKLAEKVLPGVPAAVEKCMSSAKDILEIAGAAGNFCEGKAAGASLSAGDSNGSSGASGSGR